MPETDRSEADPIESNRRINQEVWGEGNLALVDDLVAGDYVEHNPTVPEEIRGPEGYRENVERLRTAFPDLAHDQEDVFASGDWLAERVTTRGTHEGVFAGIEPTGNAIEVGSINVLHFEGGRLAEMWIQPNALGMMQQLGAFPAGNETATDGGRPGDSRTDGGRSGGERTDGPRETPHVQEGTVGGSTAEAQRNEAILREYVRECWVEGNLDRLAEYVSPEYVEHNPAVPHQIEGIEGHRANVEGFRETFPDMEIEFEAVVAAGEKTAQRMTCRGTHEGEFVGVPPTGKTVEFTSSGITRFEDGKMVEDWSQVDVLGVMQQLGVAPGPDGATE